MTESDRMTGWEPFFRGQSIGFVGREGTFLRDEKCSDLARISLAADVPGHPVHTWVVICYVISLPKVHRLYFSSEQDAIAAYDSIRQSVTCILPLIPDESDPQFDERMRAVSAAYAEIMEPFT